MELLRAPLMVVAGLALLAGGGEALVRAATTLAQRAGVTPAVIGLTVVAIGTSVPELVVSLLATFAGRPEIAVGNVVGSNIFNVAAALGATAILMPLPVHANAVRLEWPFMLAATLLFLVDARDGVIDRLEGGFFVLALALFVAYSVRLARRETSAADRAAIAAEVEERDLDAPPPDVLPSLARTLAVLAAGILALVAGGRLLVDGAVAIARQAGMTERQIALTIVAGGSGAPELATSVMAALRRHADVAVANMIGSNICNVLGILGIAALVRPLEVSPAMRASDLWWMLGSALLLYPMLRTGLIISRAQGAVLLCGYGVYVTLLLR